MTEDIRYVDTKTVNCDGTGVGDNLGHPNIYLNVGSTGKVECPYCSRVFIYEGVEGDDQH